MYQYDFSENIQRGILYLCKTDQEFIIEIANLIKVDYFEFIPHQNIFAVVYNYYETYRQLPNDDFIMEELKEVISKSESISDYQDELEEINNIDASTVSNPDYFMGLIEKFAKQSAMLEAIRQAVEEIEDGNPDAVESIVKEALLVGRSIEIGQKYFSSVGDRWHRKLTQKLSERYPTILPACDAYLEGGHSKGELCVVIAPSGKGKSLYLVNQSVKALTDGKKVLYISLEMSEDKIANRVDSIMTLIPNSSLKSPSGQLSLYKRLDMFKAEYPGAELVIKEMPTGITNVNHIRQLLHQLDLRDNFKPDLVVVDYLELLIPLRGSEAEHKAQQNIAEELRGLGMEMGFLVWTATQGNRQSESVQLITKRELGDSYGKIRPADWAISINQTQEEYDEGKARIFVVKARDSKQFYIVPMNIDYNTLRMTQGVETNESEEV